MPPDWDALASVEATIGWYFGPQSIAEDAQFALIFSARYQGRSAWFGVIAKPS